ncbi:hypothetical protein EC957_005320 [Mortierella hygrophila]|uniref:Uncharacterized protein n=1 Tax=Mortierella hygrophila TaxID=979708 RepID=A0A9P6JZS7_9FUNG|nr:hypothetical protein EC957_005320 [Mortierella hygrophila]
MCLLQKKRTVEELGIEIDIDLFVAATHQDRQQIWQVTYEQFGQMRYLPSLTVKSRDLDHSAMAGFKIRMFEPTNLRHLGLSLGGQAWIFDEIQGL